VLDAVCFLHFHRICPANVHWGNVVLHEDGTALLLLLPSSSQAQEGGEDSLAADLYDFGMAVLQLFTGSDSTRSLVRTCLTCAVYRNLTRSHSATA
jgi:hypothetical protein